MKKPKKKEAAKAVKSTKKAKPAHAKPPVPFIDASSVEQVKAMAAKAKASIAYVRGLFPKLAIMSDEERGRWSGVLSDGEDSAARAILDAAGKRPSSVPPEIKDRLERRAALVDVASDLRMLLEEVDDTARLLGELVRPALADAPHHAAE